MAQDAFIVPDAITALGPKVTEEVSRLVAAAERRHGREAAQAAESALRIVPRPLRPLARKVLGL